MPAVFFKTPAFLYAGAICTNRASANARYPSIDEYRMLRRHAAGAARILAAENSPARTDRLKCSVRIAGAGPARFPALGFCPASERRGVPMCAGQARARQRQEQRANQA
ncbi:hypothetical protein BSIN_1248 [Burkholderia singularis]|uniref:Uncharacterized protein n=1 Tax=Burkholderia singularis TaxID=1503053 RepID=A0A238HC41_9BURK|nr:hypothetical protein BSIN_1248 [Burkholderia singularis]